MSTLKPIQFVCTAILLGLTGVAAADDAVDLSQFYGFRPLEIIKLETRSQNMAAGDVNSDGRTDLVLIDNSHSRIDLLVQRKEKPETPEELDSEDINALPKLWRFDHQKLPVDEEVTALALGDLNGDNRTDIAYFGSPDRLTVRYQGDDDWNKRDRVRLADVTGGVWTMAVGDLNHDRRDDIVVLGKTVTYVLYQQQTGGLATPTRLMNTSKQLALVQVADLDGDGRNDLCYTAQGDGDRVLCVRVQSDAGTLGPELQFELNRPRSVTVAEANEQPGKEILIVETRTNRVKMLKLKRPQANPGELAARPIQYGFGEAGSGRDRAIAIGDVNADGLQDVVVTDPSAAQTVVYRQHAGRGLDGGTTFPGLVGASQVSIADLDDRAGNEVYVLSAKEKTLGQSRFVDGRLTFPDALPVQDEPVAMTVADLKGDGSTELVYIARQREGRSSEMYFRSLTHRDGKWLPSKDDVKLTLSGTPVSMQQLDANRDNRPDFMLYFGFDRPPMLLTTDAAGKPSVVETQGGFQLGDVSAGSIFVRKNGDADKHGVLLAARDNFTRDLELTDNQWKVRDQYNATDSNAKIEGAASLDLDGKAGDEIVLVDTGIKKLRVLRREDSLYKRWKEVEIGAFPYVSSHTADLNGDSRDDLLLFGKGRFAVLYAGRTDPKLETIASYESKLQKTQFGDVAAGDLNGDGQTDLVTVDLRSHYIELLHHSKAKGLRKALHFKLYEEKSFGSRGGSGSEPRETLTADVTGDGLADLIFLAHDRVVIYPQDDGK